MTPDDPEAVTEPIGRHLAALANEVDLPDRAVAICALRLAEAAPALLAVLAKAADGTPLSEGEARLLLRGVFILGGGRDTGAFPILQRFLRRPEVELHRYLGPALEVGLPQVLSGLFDGDAEALLALATDTACIADVRISAMEAAAFLTFDGRMARERMRTFLADFATASLAKGEYIWIAWSDAIARLGLRDLAHLVEAAFADGRIEKAAMRKRQFDKVLATAEAKPDDARRFAAASYITDVLEAPDWARSDEVSNDGWVEDTSKGARIEVYLATLGTDLHLPEVALRTCVARFAEAGPGLRALLDRAAAGKALAEDESLRLFRGLYVLAAARDMQCCPSLLRLLRRPETEELLGDAVTVSLPRLLISVFDNDAEALLAVIADVSLDDFVRGTTLDAATYLAWEGRIDRERLRRFLVAFYEKRLAEDEAYVWFAWMMAVARLDFGDLLSMVETAWKTRRIDHSMLEWSDFRTEIARARTAWDEVDRFATSQVGCVDDVVAELEWTRHWGDEDVSAPTEDWELPAYDEPASNPFRNVGRNDPCPCGSGKKFKKCCLAA